MKRSVLVLITLLLFLTGGFFFLYFKAGLREHLVVLQKISNIEEVAAKEDALKIFFDGVDGQSTGGTLAWIGNDSVLVWGKGGIRSFPAKVVETFVFPDCGKKSGKIGYADHHSIKDWGDDIRVGDQVFVKIKDLNKGSDSELVFSVYRIAWAEVSGVPIFCQSNNNETNEIRN